VDPLRTQRVEVTMREELSELIRFELSDPRVLGVDVADVHCDPKMTKADVLVTLPTEEKSRTKALEGLEHARNFLRHQLVERLNLYRVPDLRFVSGTETRTGAELNKLLRRVRRGRALE
jgi:ribosome-binding factor A